MSLSFDKLSLFLKENNYNILSKYTIKKILKIILINNIQTGEQLLLTLSDKYQMETSGTEIIKFDDIIDETLFSEQTSLCAIISDENIIDDKYLDSKDVDKLMEKYQSINLTDEQIEHLKQHLFTIRNQLKRVKNSFLKIRYKIGITSETIIGYISRNNEVECFVIKTGNIMKNITKKANVCLDLESFYEKINSIETDLRIMRKNF